MRGLLFLALVLQGQASSEEPNPVFMRLGVSSPITTWRTSSTQGMCCRTQQAHIMTEAAPQGGWCSLLWKLHFFLRDHTVQTTLLTTELPLCFIRPTDFVPGAQQLVSVRFSCVFGNWTPFVQSTVELFDSRSAIRVYPLDSKQRLRGWVCTHLVELFRYFFNPFKGFSKELFLLFSLMFNCWVRIVSLENFAHPYFSQRSFLLQAASVCGESEDKDTRKELNNKCRVKFVEGEWREACWLSVIGLDFKI